MRGRASNMSNNELLEWMGSPETLEFLYRKKPEQFRTWLNEAIIKHPESETLKVWNARINFTRFSFIPETKVSLFIVVIISLASGFLVKLPAFLPITEKWFYPRFAPLIVICALICYFLPVINSFKIKSIIIIGLFLCTTVMLLLPDNPKSPSIIMSQIHMPLVLGSLLALAFMADDWKKPDARLLYVRYVGEVIIYSIIILIGGIVLTLLTFGLFGLIGLSIREWYISHIVVFGLVATPVVATFLYDSALRRVSKIAILISNVFSPLLLITVFVYLLAILYQGKSPYADREFFISFNGLLVIVLAVTVFSISGKSKPETSRVVDKVNISLVSVTLLINTVALSAILFRLSEYGITPNRIAVTGSNILIFIHLVLILKAYIHQYKNSDSPDKLKKVVANYLPIYSSWSVFIGIILPVLFTFR